MKYSRKNKPRRATLILAGLASIASLNTNASVIINEIDYDQPGSDTSEFIELFNNGPSNILLDGYFIDLINGGNNTVYRSIDLTGFNVESGNYFVICNDPLLVANCNYDFTDITGWFQNGLNDAIALYDEMGLLDSLSYEGELAPFTEGSTLTDADSNSITTSISRLPDGIDTNDNGLDFHLGCTTPGSSNILGNGDCSAPAVVPIPAAAWLFGSGLAGIIGISRRKNKKS